VILWVYPALPLYGGFWPGRLCAGGYVRSLRTVLSTAQWFSFSFFHYPFISVSECGSVNWLLWVSDDTLNICILIAWHAAAIHSPKLILHCNRKVPSFYLRVYTVQLKHILSQVYCLQGRGKSGSGGSTDPLKFEIGVKKLIPRLCRTGRLFLTLTLLLKNGSRAPDCLLRRNMQN